MGSWGWGPGGDASRVAAKVVGAGFWAQGGAIGRRGPAWAADQLLMRLEGREARRVKVSLATDLDEVAGAGRALFWAPGAGGTIYTTSVEH